MNHDHPFHKQAEHLPCPQTTAFPEAQPGAAPRLLPVLLSEVCDTTRQRTATSTPEADQEIRTKHNTMHKPPKIPHLICLVAS